LTCAWRSSTAAADAYTPRHRLSAGAKEKMNLGSRHQGMLSTNAVTFIWVAVVERMTWRCVERGYRYLHLDAGHDCQNLYLAAEAIQHSTSQVPVFEITKNFFTDEYSTSTTNKTVNGVSVSQLSQLFCAINIFLIIAIPSPKIGRHKVGFCSKVFVDQDKTQTTKSPQWIF
jgi:hypothetical protein